MAHMLILAAAAMAQGQVPQVRSANGDLMLEVSSSNRIYALNGANSIDILDLASAISAASSSAVSAGVAAASTSSAVSAQISAAVSQAMSAAVSTAHAEVVPVSNLAAALSTNVAGISAQISNAVSTAHSETLQVGNLALSLSSAVAVNSGAVSAAASTAHAEMAQVSSLAYALSRSSDSVTATVSAMMSCNARAMFYANGTCQAPQNPTFVPASDAVCNSVANIGATRLNGSIAEVCLRSVTSGTINWVTLASVEAGAPRSCWELRRQNPSAQSGVYSLLVAEVPTLQYAQVYCNMDSFGGGWTLVYSTRDDLTGDNNFQQGTIATATVNTITPTTANKKIALDLFRWLDGGNGLSPYTQVMLSGFSSYTATGPVTSSNFIKMYFNRGRTGTYGQTDFSAFINWGIGVNVGNGCGANSFYGTELSSNRRICTTWENYAWVAGADITNGCAWGREVWQEIDAQGGHLLAPADWNSACSYSATNCGGFTRNNGIFHLWVR